ncbi:uncharacterized protein LOC124204412 [Daphnia pulex]|uniref:uncharacterized protein LOC124204412 n=1 Tax=Daphnia pulex TaxID=6669 RepID=UPI001EDD4FAD|nr:uncharacterized protein LOC124204412 [Daphnia pulex]
MVFIKNILSYSTVLFIFKIVTALQNWRSQSSVHWTENCDFEGNPVANKAMPPSKCGDFCQFTVESCTHFTFTTTSTTPNGIGTCWIKSGRIYREKAIHLDSPGSICGYLAIHWINLAELSWSFNCNFSGNDLKKEFSEGESCGALCIQNPPCNHFVWTNVEGQGICWMKFNSTISKESAVLTPGSRGAVCGILRNGGENVSTASPVSWSKDDECECVC